MLRLFPFIVYIVFTQTPTIDNGVIDLKNWNTQEILFLDGEWEFYWKKELLSEDFIRETRSYKPVPSNWVDYEENNKKIPPEGFATFRLILINVPKNISLSLAMQYQGTAYDLYINDQKKLSVGVYSSEKKLAKAKYKSAMVSFTANNDSVSIVFHVSSYDFKSGGLWQKISFGTEKELINYKRSFLAEDLFFVGAFFIIGVFYLGLFFLPSNDKTVLIFAIFSLSMSIRQMITNEGFFFDLFPNMSWDIQIRIIYTTLYILVPTFTIFFYRIFKEVVPKLFIKTFLVLSGGLFVLPLITPPSFFSRSLNIFHLVMLVGSVFLMYYLVLAIRRKLVGSALTLSGFSIIFLASVNDVLHVNGVVQTGFYLGPGVFCFILSQSMILALKSSKLTEYIQFLLNEEKGKNDEIVKLSNELEQSNLELENKIEERTHSLAVAKEKAEAASEAKSNFLSTMTHEFRTPLNAILGYTDIMLGYTYLSDSDREKLAIIRDSGNHLLELVNSSLEMSKIKAGKTVIVSEKFNLPDLLYSIKNMFLLKCEKKNIGLILTIQPILSDFIYSDHSKLKQILINLVGNAVKYTDKGRIEINVSSDNGQMLNFSINDTGIGIKEEYLSHILEPFHQVDSKTNIGGTGLGLSIVLSYVKAMGGDFDIKSQFGSGTNMSFTIPIKFDEESMSIIEQVEELTEEKVQVSFVEENIHQIKKIDDKIYSKIEDAVFIGDFVEVLNIVKELNSTGEEISKITSYLANAASNFDTKAFDDFFSSLRDEDILK